MLFKGMVITVPFFLGSVRMDNVSVLNLNAEEEIKCFIEKIFEKDRLRDFFPNALLREDVLELLDKYCTVIYYPLKGESNNGFRIKEIPFADGSQQDFVFINTAQAMEKQVFTAAHELGHIWNVDDYIVEKLGLPQTQEQREMVVNRFAAILLMPKDIFTVSARGALDELADSESKSIRVIDLLKVIAILMNQFFVPMKSVVLRLVELGFIKNQAADMLLGYRDIPIQEVEDLVEVIITELGFVKLLKPSNKKWIEGLSEKLDIAERHSLVSQNKINLLRKKFDLPPKGSALPGMQEQITLDTRGG